mgnify:CR=1 FL=1
MDGQRRFAVIGTDPRLAAAGRALARAGFAVGGPEQTALADYILLLSLIHISEPTRP